MNNSLQVRNFKFDTIHQIQTLTLVASVVHAHQGQDAVSHAMVLDTYEPNQDMLIFKNTYNDESSGQPKQFKIKRTDPNAPEELFFVHIEVKDMDNLPSQEQREAEKKAEERAKYEEYGIEY